MAHSGAYNTGGLNSGQVAIPTTSGGTLLIAANNRRDRITISNPGSGHTLYLGQTGLSSSTGYPLLSGAILVLHTTAAIYALADTAQITVSYFEETS